VVAGRRQEDLAGERAVARLHQLDRPPGPLPEPVGQAGEEGQVEVLDDHHRGVAGVGQAGEDLSQRGGAAGGAADDHQGPRRRPLRQGRRWRRGRVGEGLDHPGRAADELGDGRDLVEHVARPGHVARGAQFRGVDRVERPQAHGLVDPPQMGPDRAGHDHDGAGRLGHDPPGGLDSIEDRHDQVHQDQVGPVGPGQLDGLGAVAGEPGDLVVGHRGDGAPERLAGHHQVVDDPDPHAWASPIRSATASRKVRS